MVTAQCHCALSCISAGPLHIGMFQRILPKSISARNPASCEHPTSRCILVSRVPRARVTEDKIEILPWRSFLKLIWEGELLQV